MLFEGVKSWSPGSMIIPGQRTQDNHVLTPSGEIHHYVSAVQVPFKMDKLLEWLTISSPMLHPIRLAADFHHRFVAIHPFQDGNDRVGGLYEFHPYKSRLPTRNHSKRRTTGLLFGP